MDLSEKYSSISWKDLSLIADSKLIDSSTKVREAVLSRINYLIKSKGKYV